MWKRVKESTSGFNWNFMSNLLRRRNYSKFESEESSDITYTGIPPASLKDEENNDISWKSERQKFGSHGNESGYGSVCTTPHSDIEVFDQSVVPNSDHIDSDYQDNEHFSQKYPHSSRIHGHGRQDSVSDPEKTFRSVSYKVKGEVKEVINIFQPNRYNRLDVEEDMSDDDDQVEIEDLQYSEVSGENNDSVFHSAKDIHPECRNKPKRWSKKKVGKRTRRVLRTSWKWMKKGFMEYARSLHTPNLLVIVNPGVFKRR